MPQTPQSPQVQQTKALINEEEVRTELLATIAAARELGPDMDQTLASRWVDQFATLFPNPARDKDRLRGDVETLLVTARGHGADADPARVKDFLAHALVTPPAPPAPIRQAQPASRGNLAPYLPMILGVAVFIAVLIATQGHLWWLVFVIPGLFWGGRGSRRKRYRRYGDWYGMGPGTPPSNGRQLPPGNDPEML